MTARQVSWSDILPDVRPFDELSPVDIVYWLEQCIRASEEYPENSLRAGLEAAARIRAWWQSLEDQGTKLDPYPELAGDGYLWSALNLVSRAVGTGLGDPSVWNVLRRAEANMRAWWLERASRTETVVLFEVDDPSPYLCLNTTGTTTTSTTISTNFDSLPRSRPEKPGGWDWLEGRQ